MDEFAVTVFAPLSLECLSEQIPDLKALVSSYGQRVGDRIMSWLRAQFLQSSRSKFRYLFCTTVLLGMLQNLTEYLFCYPSFFFLHHNRWIIMEYYGSVWHLSFCCTLNALWKEMKYGNISVLSIFTQCVLMATIIVCSFTQPDIAVHLWQVWSYMQGILEI